MLTLATTAETTESTNPTDTAEPTPSVTTPATEGEDTTPAKKGCRSNVSVVLPLLAIASAPALTKRDTPKAKRRRAKR